MKTRKIARSFVTAAAVTGMINWGLAAERPLSPPWDNPSTTPKTLTNAGSWLNEQMANAANDDVFILPAGVYKLDEPVTVKARTTLRGEDRDAVILDGLGGGNCVRIEGIQSNNKLIRTTLSTLTVRNGYIGKTEQEAGVYGGAGVYMCGTSDTITNCIIEKCTAVGHEADYQIGGGGVCCRSQYGIISDCVFRDNVITNDAAAKFDGGNSGFYAMRGGALSVNIADVCVRGCAFVRNRAVSLLRNKSNAASGGALCNGADGTVIENCDFEGNEVIGNGSGGNGIGRGGAVETAWATCYMTNCSFTANCSSDMGGAVCMANTGGIFSGCSFMENVAKKGPSCVESNGNVFYADCYFAENISYATANSNGGCLMIASGKDVVSRCAFVNNSTPDGYGGVVFANAYGDDLSVIITSFDECVFVGNSAKYGGVFYVRQNRCIDIDSCIFDGNSSPNDGAAINAASSPYAVVRNSFFTRNVGKTILDVGGYRKFSADFPEAGPRAIVDNCTIVGNIVSNGGNHAVQMRSAKAQGTYPAGWDGSMLRNAVIAENYKWSNGALNKSAQFNLVLNPATGIGIEAFNSVIGEQATLPVGFGAGTASETGNVMTDTAAIAFHDMEKDDWRLDGKSVAHGTAVRPEWMDVTKLDMGKGTYSMTFFDPVRKTGMSLSFDRRRKWTDGAAAGDATDAGCFRYKLIGGLIISVY